MVCVRIEHGVIPCDVTFWTARWITLDYNVVHLKAWADGQEVFLLAKNSLPLVSTIGWVRVEDVKCSSAKGSFPWRAYNSTE
jgi:hypothetical protein